MRPGDVTFGEAGPVEPAVAFVCHPYHRGGVTRWMVDAVVECSRRRVPVWLVCPEPRREFISAGGRPTVLSLVRRAADPSVLRVCAPQVGWPYELGTTAYRAVVYSDAIRSGVPEGVPVIVSDDAAAWAGAAKMAGRNPMIGVLHADEPGYYRLADMHQKALSALVCVSCRITRRISTVIGLPSSRIVTIPCGIPITVGARADGTLANRPIRLIWVGRIEEGQKRVSDLVRIGTALREQGIDFRLEIVGDGPQRSWLQELVSDARLQDVVSFAGWLPAELVHQRLTEADVLLLPSNHEGMPIVVMEALAAGCGVVATRVSGLEDYESHPLANDVFRLFPVGDCQDAVRLLLAIARIPLAERVAGARALAEAEFSIGRSVDRYLAVARALACTPCEASVAPSIRDRLVPAASHLMAAARYVRVRPGRLRNLAPVESPERR